MPTENEQKFVLNLDCENEFKSSRSESAYEIRQAYLDGSSARIRKKKRIRISGTGDWGEPVYEFCYKFQSVTRVIEIQTEIFERDFLELWQQSKIKLSKIRYNVIAVLGNRKRLWEVDFFKDGEQNYFAMAECEMPEKQLHPDFIPDIISNNLVFEVPIGDERFASKRIADMEYAKKLYCELKEKV